MREQREPLNLYVSDFDRLLAEKKNLEKDYEKLEAENKKLSTIIRLQGVNLKSITAERDELQKQVECLRAWGKADAEGRYKAETERDELKTILEKVFNMIKDEYESREGDGAFEKVLQQIDKEGE